MIKWSLWKIKKIKNKNPWFYHIYSQEHYPIPGSWWKLHGKGEIHKWFSETTQMTWADNEEVEDSKVNNGGRECLGEVIHLLPVKLCVSSRISLHSLEACDIDCQWIHHLSINIGLGRVQNHSSSLALVRLCSYKCVCYLWQYKSDTARNDVAKWGVRKPKSHADDVKWTLKGTVL